MAREFGVSFSLGANLDGSFGSSFKAASDRIGAVTQALRDMVPDTKLPGLIEVLRQDPRRAGSKHEPNRVYHLAYAGLDISFTVDGTRLTITAINDARD